jgi:CxxC-x17-CxxC domain-containing protein
MAYGYNRGFSRRRRFPREMHKITCAECGKEDEVPFKPREGTPVLCKECYFKKKGITPKKQEGEEQETKEDKEEESKEEEKIEESEETKEEKEEEKE